jgi:hypothetical protein
MRARRSLQEARRSRCAFSCNGRPSSGAPRHLLPSGRREGGVAVPSTNLIPAPRTHAYSPPAPPDQGGCREASCGRAGLRVSSPRPLRAEGGGGADRHRAGESGRATRDPDNQKAIWSAQKTCARGGVAAVGAASTRHSTSTSARSRRLRRHPRPAHPLGYALKSPKPRGASRSGLSVRRGAERWFSRRLSGASRSEEPGTQSRSSSRSGGPCRRPVFERASVLGSGLALRAPRNDGV